MSFKNLFGPGAKTSGRVDLKLCLLLLSLILVGTLVTSIARANTYTLWKTQVFTAADQSNPAVSSELANPSHDGISNLQKYAFGLNPYTSASTGTPSLSFFQQGGLTYPALTYQVPSANPPTDILYTPQSSPDMMTWSQGSALTLAGTSGPTNGLNYYTYFANTLPISSANKGFMRLQVLETSTAREFNDAFTGSTFSANWSPIQGGSTGSSATVNNGLTLTTPAANSYAWVCSSWNTYSLGSAATGNIPLLIQATMGAPTFPSSTYGSGFSIVLASGANAAPKSSTINPAISATNALELRYFANADNATGTLRLYGKTTANSPTVSLGAISLSLPLTLQNVSLALSNLNGSLCVTVTCGNASASQAGTTSASFTLPAYGAAFADGHAVYLYIMASSGSGGGETMAISQVSASSGFADTFPGTSLSLSNWATSNYGGGSGAGSGGTSSATTMSAGALSLNANLTTRWLSLAPSNYSFLNNTETFQTSLTSLSNGATGSMVSIVLSPTPPTSAGTDPVANSSNDLEMRLTTKSSLTTGSLELFGKLNGTSALIADPTNADTNDPQMVAVPFTTTASTGRGTLTMGITLSNSGSASTSTVTLFYNNPVTGEPISQTIMLPVTYNTAFAANPIYAYLRVGAVGGSNTETAVFSQFSALTQPVQSATINVGSTQSQSMGFGGDYCKGNLTPGVATVLDNPGTYTLANLKPTWARVPLPLYSWEPVNQHITAANIKTLITPTTGYLAQQDTGDLHDILLRIKALETPAFGGSGTVTNFIFSMWDIEGWMTDGPSYTMPPVTDVTSQDNILAGIASFLMYAHNQYGLDLTHTYISFNEPDIGVDNIITAAQYASYVSLSGGNSGTAGYFNTLGLTGVSGMPAAIPWVVGETGPCEGYAGQYQEVGTVLYNGFLGSYTSNILAAVKTNEGGTLATTNVVIGFHAYDGPTPQVYSFIPQESAFYGNIPIICDEVGINNDYDTAATTGTPFDTYETPTWDRAMKLAANYQKLFNYAGISAAVYWSFMADTPVASNASPAVPYRLYYPIQQLMQCFTGLARLPSTAYGQIDALAGGLTGNPRSVQVLQADSRPLNVQVTGLYPNTIANGSKATYAVYWVNYSSGKNVLLNTCTTDRNGTITINIPAAPVEPLTISGAPTYWDSGSSVIITDLPTSF